MRGKSKRSQRWTSAQPRGLGDTLSGFRRAPLVAVAAVVVFFVGVTVASAIVFGETKLTASDGAEGDRFGRAVAVAGERLAVGAVHDDNLNGTDAGAAYLYEPDGSGGWTETKLTASDGENGDWFGSAVAISGDRLVVGAEREGGAVGAAYVLEFDETAGWVEQAKLEASDGGVGDQFGISVAISGDRIVVGARGDDDNGTDAGAAYVYEADGNGGWTETKLLASDLEAGWFGHSVAISGDRIVVGAFRSDLSPGAAYVYEPDGSGGWAETKIMASDGQDNDQFGISVAVSGDRIVVGADFNHTELEDNAGAAYVYEADGSGDWTETAKLTESEEEAGFFGHVVAVSGDRTVVGAPGNVPGQPNDRPGTAYVYDLDDAGDWNGVRLKPASEVELSDLYGRAVALSGDQVGDRIAVGAREDDDNGVAAGAVYLYDDISEEPDPSNEPPSVDAGPEVSGAVGKAIPIQGTATDPDDDPLTISWTADTTACTFADAAALNTTVTCTEIGFHTLTLTASDSINDPVSDSTTAVIEDVTPPVLVVPDTISVEAPTPDGAIVEFVVTATDNVDPDPTVVCDPTSGSLFPIGDTTVTCTATDASGNSSSDTFLVTVSIGASTFDGFISQVESLDLANGTETSLVKKIEAAQQQFIDGDLEDAAETLQSLIDQVDAQEDKKLTSAEAAQIRTAAQTLIEAIT